MLGDLVIGSPACYLLQVLIEREAVVDLQAAVVFPFVGIADLDDEVGELVLGLGFRGCTHPGGLVDTLCECCLEVVHELQHAQLARGGEILVDIELADGLPEGAAHEVHGAFPAWAVLLDTRQHLTQCTGNDLRLGIRLEVVEGRVDENLLHLMDRLGLADIDEVESGETRGEEDVAPVDAGEVVDKLVVGHLVVVGIDVAQLHLVVTHLGDPCLDGEHSLHLLLSRGFVGTGEHEELLEILFVSLEHALVLCIIGDIIVALAESQSALADAYEVPLGIFLVGADPDAEHHRTLTVTVELGAHELILLAVLDGGNLVERRLDRRPALAVEARGVHHEVVERADLLPE